MEAAQLGEKPPSERMVWVTVFDQLVVYLCDVCFSETKLHYWNVPARPVRPLPAAPRLLFPLRPREGHSRATTGPHWPQGGAHGETRCSEHFHSFRLENLPLLRVSKESCQIREVVTLLPLGDYFLVQVRTPLQPLTTAAAVMPLRPMY